MSVVPSSIGIPTVHFLLLPMIKMMMLCVDHGEGAGRALTSAATAVRASRCVTSSVSPTPGSAWGLVMGIGIIRRWPAARARPLRVEASDGRGHGGKWLLLLLWLLLTIVAE